MHKLNRWSANGGARPATRLRKLDIDPERCEVQVRFNHQSLDISQGVDTGGAGDQGMMFGYATDETPERMPAPILYAHRLVRRQSEVRRSGQLPWLSRWMQSRKLPSSTETDSQLRSRVSGRSTQHDEFIGHEELCNAVQQHIIDPVIPQELRGTGFRLLINPTGRFVTGWPKGDTGLTGRKIIVDTYGGAAPHGGGAFSGKDPSKVDRSAAYMARFLAKQVVARGWAMRARWFNGCDAIALPSRSAFWWRHTGLRVIHGGTLQRNSPASSKPAPAGDHRNSPSSAPPLLITRCLWRMGILAEPMLLFPGRKRCRKAGEMRLGLAGCGASARSLNHRARVENRCRLVRRGCIESFRC